MALPDVIVVGGGINGVSIAFNLARRGVRVTLLERRFVAAGPTGRSSAIVRQHYSSRVTARMALRGLRVFQRFDDVVGGYCGFRETGFLITAGPEDAASLEANVKLQRSVGIGTELLSPQEVRGLEPDLRTDAIACAAYEPEGGYANPHLTATAYAARADELGATLLTGTPVLSLVVEHGRVTGVTTPDGRLDAGAVVVATGPWARGLLEPLGVELPVVVGRPRVCFFRGPAGVASRHVLADTETGIYLRPEGGDRILVGSIGTEEADGRVDDPDRFDEGVDFATVAAFSERLSHRFPAMAGGRHTGGYASLYDITPDWNPILGPVPGADGFYCAVGSSGHGFKLAPAVGEMMAALVFEEAGVPDPDVFGLARFDHAESVAGAYRHKILG